MTNIYKLESLPDHFIESDPDRAERWMESTLAKIELRKRLAHRKAITPLPNTAQQEPVAWTDENFMALYVSEDIAEDQGANIPLYTRPQAREPLTDEQIQTIAFEAVKDNWDWLRFARAIEAAIAKAQGETK